MTRNGSSLILKALTDYNIDTIMGIPGGPMVPFLDEVAQSKINWLNGTNEMNAGFMAQGWSRARDTPGCICVTSGPGLSMTVNPVKNAFDEHYPLLIIAPLTIASDPSQWQFLDSSAFSTFTNAIFENTTLQDIATNIKKALQLTISGTEKRPYAGPVLFLVKPSLFLEKIPDTLVPVLPAKRKENILSLEKIVAPYQGKKVCILLGGGVDTPENRRMAQQLSNQWNAPIVHTWKGKGIVDDFGMVGSLGTHTANYVTLTSDLMIEIGNYSLSIQTDFYYNRFGFALFGGKRLLVSHMNDNRNKDTSIFVKGLAGDALQSLLNISIKVPDDWLNDIKTFQSMSSFLPRTPIQTWSTENALDKLQDKVRDKVVVTGVGNHWYSAGKYLTPDKWLSWTNWASIGCGYPVGMGYAMGSDEDVWIVEGDGGLVFNLTVFLETFQKELKGKNVKIVLIRDRQYGAIESAFKIDKLIYDEAASLHEYDRLSVEKMCELFSIGYTRVSSPEEWVRSISQTRQGIELFELEVDDNSVYEINLNEEYKRALLEKDTIYLSNPEKVYAIASSDVFEDSGKNLSGTNKMVSETRIVLADIVAALHLLLLVYVIWASIFGNPRHAWIPIFLIALMYFDWGLDSKGRCIITLIEDRLRGRTSDSSFVNSIQKFFTHKDITSEEVDRILKVTYSILTFIALFRFKHYCHKKK